MRVCWAQWFFMVVVAFIGVTQMLTACGNKGPLFVPTEEQIAQMEKEKQTAVADNGTEDELDLLDAQNELDVKKEKAE